MDRVFHSALVEIWHNKSDEGPGLDFRIHSHAHHEILYVFYGDVEFYVEGYKYPLLPESLLLTPANNFHGWKPCSGHLYHRVSILFMPELLDKAEQSFFLELFNAGPRFFTDGSSRNIGFFVETLLECAGMEPPLREIALKSRLVSLLSEISLLPLNHKCLPTTHKDKRVHDVLKYLGEHLLEELSLEQVSRRFNISKNYLNILFRQAIGTTVNQYIRIKRLTLARQEILNGCGVEEAAYKAGFNNYSNFYRAYKAFFGDMPSVKTGK
jgi:AraC-like DNA-binding protein